MIETGEAPKNEVIIHRAHRIPYDPAIRLAGARIVEVGNRLQTFPWELEAAITPRTAMVFYAAGVHLASGALPLAETVEIAHAHGIPVVVDAAAQLPPTENLWRFTREFGADLAVFSGGKDFRGPQASGLLVGTEAMIAAIAVNGSPHQRLARPMKVGKEEMIGLLAAVERYVNEDWRDRARRYEETVERWIEHFRARAWSGRLARLPERGRAADAALPRDVRRRDRVERRRGGQAALGRRPAHRRRRRWPRRDLDDPELLAEGEESILLERIAALTLAPAAASAS